MENFNLKYFLAANSCEGFVSFFDSCYNAKNGWRAYIIKGGPGTGKSSFMKFLAVKAAEKGLTAELCPCSSDPDSLDAVILPQIKTAIMDGTAPHTVDPVYPGICEQILDFGRFWKTEKLNQHKKEILAVTDRNKALHKSASRYLNAAGRLILDNLHIAAACTDKAKTKKFADSLCKKLIPKTNVNGCENLRFLGGITPKGVVSFTNTVLYSVKKTVIIEDEHGSVSNIIMERLRSHAIEMGYNIITVKNCFLPSQLTDHIIIPQLSIAFVRESQYTHFKCDHRRIHARRFLNASQLSKSRERIRFNKKTAQQLIVSAATVLAEAKAVHDKLEKFYISAMDFNALTELANSFVLNSIL